MVELLGMVISGVSLFIAAILAFLVIYANRFLIKRRNKEFALYLTLGMRKGDLFKVSALETCIVGTLSLVVGLALGVGISQVLSNVAASMFDTAVEGVSFSISAETLVYTVAVFAVIFFVTVALNTGYLFKAKLIDLLHGDRKNEVLTLRSLPLFVLFVYQQSSISYSRWTTALRSTGSSSATVLRGDIAVLHSLSGFLPVSSDDKTFVSARVVMFFLRQLSTREFRVRVHERSR
ncbi:MAG: FtsX-like permease family protein [Slackia sp.]